MNVTQNVAGIENVRKSRYAPRTMKTIDFDYHLPPRLITQTPASPRDSSRVLVLDRTTGVITHHRFFEIGKFLRPGDLMVVNDTKVFHARLHADGMEIFLLRSEGSHWLALAKPGRKLARGSVVIISPGTTCRVVEKRQGGTIVIDFGMSPEDVFALADRIGEVPLPPYIHSTATNDVRRGINYQTVYAKEVGSAAAPTAGFHFTPELIDQLKSSGINFSTVTLHVGLGTFRPIKTDMLEAHHMHEEWMDVPNETTAAIEETKRRGGRVIAVGTTTVRALESGVHHGFTNVFITPGYRFKIVDALITNFHLPKSTLLVLVSAFAGRDLIQKAYAEAIKHGYRFYSFGDAMLIV